MGSGLARGDAPGWRTADGILVFGGWSQKDETDLAEVRLLNNDFSSSGKFKQSLETQILNTAI